MRPHTRFKLTNGLETRLLPSLLAAGMIAICLGGSLPAEDTETARQGDEWHLVHLQGKAAGYSLLRKLEGENGELETISFTRITMRRGTQKTTVEERLEMREDAAGKILGFRKEEKKAQQAVTTIGKMISPDRMELEVTSGNSPPRKQVIPFNPATRGLQHTTKKISSTLKKKGDRVEVVVFMSDLSRCIRQISTLQAREGKLRRIESRLELAPGNSLVLLEWITDAGQSVRSSMPYLGLETVLSSREKIVATDFSSPPEIFFSSGIPLGRFLGWKREEILYRLRLRDSKQPVQLLDSGAAGHQLTATTEEGTWHLRVQTVRQDAARELPINPTPPLKPYLSSTAYIQSDDARIIELAKKAAGNEKNSLEVARKLEKWVYNYIRKKNLGTAFATAKEVLETRQGDCTEHAVLMAAMCRAAGIPSRVVAGLVYYRKSFVGHMWTEVYTGKWVPLDATIGKGKVEADHIALSVSALDNTSISEIFIGLLPFLGNMEIEVLETR